MGTRSTINIIDENGNQAVSIYHHWDGYPEGVGAELNEMFEEDLALAKKKQRWLDVPYFVNKMIKYQDSNYEFTIGIHSDIEYLYEINLQTLEMKCWEVWYNDEKGDYDRFEEIDLSKYHLEK